MAILTPLRLFLLIITNAGGEGKTHLTLLLRALFDLLDEVELTLDADPGNKAASSTGSPSIKFLDPFFDADEAIAKVKGALTSSTSLLIDAGANMQAASRQFEDTCIGLGDFLTEAGYVVRGLWVISPNKLGAAGSLVRDMRRIDPPLGAIVVFNNRDNSGAVPDGIEPEIRIEQLPPGLVALTIKHGGLAQIVRSGIAEHQHSADMIAAYLWRFADQPGVRRLFGDDRVDSLRSQLDRQTLDISPYKLETPHADRELEAMSRRARLLRHIMPHLDDVGRVREALDVYR